MYTFQNFLKILLITLVITSCTDDTQQLMSQEENVSNYSAKQNRIVSRRNYSSNTLVLMFNRNTTASTKRLIRNYYNVQNFEICKNCSDESIELWTFNDTIQIEPKKETIDNPNGGWRMVIINNVVSVDFNYHIKTSSNRNAISTAAGGKNSSKLNPNLSLLSYQSYIKPFNDGITIGVFDTGINPSVVDNSTPVFPSSFLYNASNDGIPTIYTGWDFVNMDNDAYDDDANLHGTSVSSIITKNLDNANIKHQIMPLKIADANGNISYFNLVCSLNYALERKIIVLQMSLGWYTNSPDMDNSVFESLLTQYQGAIVVASAGNIGNNNDVNKHWPSCFSSSQIIAVASCNMNGQISGWSNFGKETVDYVAKGEGITFLGNPIEGTSFATPIVTARVARIKYELPSITNSALILALNNSGNNFETLNLIKENKIIF